MKEKKIKTIAFLMLFSASLIFGSSFLVMKKTIDGIPEFFTLAIRFFFAGVVLSLLFIKKWKQFRLSYLLEGSVMGFFLFCGYGFQTVGLAHTTPGKNAFLTAFYCIIVPFLNWAAVKKKPEPITFLSAAICIAGIGLVSLNADLSVGLGDFLTLICGFLFAFHIVFATKFSQNKDIILLTIIQFLSCGVYSTVISLAFETPPQTVSRETVFNMVYLCVFATTIALLFQNVGQKYLSPASSSLILSLESVFGVIFSMLFGYERLTLKTAVGFVLIFTAVTLSQIDFKKKRPACANV